MKKVLFLDRDGTLLVEPADNFQVDAFEKLEFLPGVITSLARIARETDFELVIVTNQDGLGTSSLPDDAFWPPHTLMLKVFESEGVKFSRVLIDRSFAHENKPTRKPGTALLSEFLNGDYDLENSFVVGDRITDMQLAEAIRARGILLGATDDKSSKAYLSAPTWHDILPIILGSGARASVERVTRETSIKVELALYGGGRTEVSTGLGFFDHMLDLLGYHAGFDTKIAATGDLHVDEHHLIEDVGIALGQAFANACASKAGLGRYGFLLPMDESLAQIALDLSGRNHLEWKVEFKREKIGDVPTEMFKHFFKSFSDAARCSLHISVAGENEHHKIEAIFKGVGRCLRTAVEKQNRSLGIPSTKGTL